MNPTISFIYTVDPDADEPIMLIDKHIGFDEADGWGIMGDLFQKELLALDGMDKKRIQVWINSPGGYVSDGYNIYNAMLRTKTPVDTYNTGIAASIAGVIFQGGRKRIMADYSKLMYHNPFGGDDDSLNAYRDSIATMVATRCGKPEDDIKAIMNQTTWIGAEEALDNGFCDEIQDSGQLNKKRGIKTPEEAKAFWRESNKILNSLFSKNTFDMKKIANRLKLNPDASEESVVAAIDELEGSKKALETEVQNKKAEISNKNNDLEKKEKELAKMQEECDKLKAEIKDMKDKAKAKEDEEAKAKEEELEEKAKNMIEGFVKDGRIKNDADIIKSWTDKAKADFDGVKNLLTTLPINKKAAPIITEPGGDKGKGKVGSVIAATMNKKYQDAVGKI